MSESIDVTGLSREAIRALESLVGLLRDTNRSPAPDAPSVFDLFGKAKQLRTGEDIARQFQEERDAWGKP